MKKFGFIIYTICEKETRYFCQLAATIAFLVSLLARIILWLASDYSLVGLSGKAQSSSTGLKFQKVAGLASILLLKYT
jgi:hypothetical protein